MSDAVWKYFDRTAAVFDTIYDDKQSPSRFYHRCFRRGLFECYAATMEACGDCGGKEVLDVGCGPGHYLVEFARRGAHVTGIDISPRMLDFAKARLERHGQTSFELIRGNAKEIEFGRKFDVVVAIGLAEYLVRPEDLLERLSTLSRQMVIVSFPARSLFRGRLRSWRYRFLCGIELRFFEPLEIREMARAAGLDVRDLVYIRSSGGGWMLIGSPKGAT